MRNKVTKAAAILLGAVIYAAGATTVFATEFSDGVISGVASDAMGIAKDKAQKYEEEQREARMAMAQKKAEEAHRNVEKIMREQKEEAARKAAEEARKKRERIRAAEAARVARRQEIVDFAVQFEGNPYVYGGTSLTNGADCSGFIMAVFKEFGYELPRVAAAQYDSSTKKDISEMEIGDLVFYGHGGIGHVGLYIGGGKIIHASTSASGIKISDYDYETPAGIGTYLK